MRIVAPVQLTEVAQLMYDGVHGSPEFLLLFGSRKSGIWIIDILSYAQGAMCDIELSDWKNSYLLTTSFPCLKHFQRLLLSFVHFHGY